MNKRVRRRGIFLLPNLFTTGCLFFGFMAVISAIDGEFGRAAVAVLVAMVFDGLDGRVARLTGTQSDFGVQYDSLADMVSFGLAPAAVAFLWALGNTGAGTPWDNVGWLVAFLFVAGAALRLARFNTQSGVDDKRHFQGLPSPAAAGAVVGLVWFGDRIGLTGLEAAIPVGVVVVLGAVLMVSNVRYESFKELDFRYRVRFTSVVGLVLAMALVAVHPPTAICLGFLIYMFSGPVLTVLRLRRRRRHRRA
ncbi:MULTISPECIES: CDP-diacylglycerol--serine O-phosphatidyltransferase [Halorhodospira]|uniref:CDP-diacylglycerol--serine O-phosphatidyltransferase n=1 Tax=Halorhodospira TaxID=85108 RepID=UPI00191282BC|nr:MULTISPECIES: CDP-diacylglycerol--serine O-phosphatidyltransferase [Halorhodospira]MBK5937536.1 CDP-diacylglycerol--serine O-phosphatidyltransferase [Halorhodospira halophila]MCG5528543.1 CDP-diacylglycerol--serine O-phosphatidyltransferase [Halorhodospira halophila]MCG5537434.1 CDP-diacylglycerol--serine O-phosphatidyltransferase [Halorhodospira sp. 9622]MCG5541426.1 CDP-diacylglycerol--serine O-phosphatidyltransferase [Halorhodospira sp. M39old]MCG5543794.1 CDP-diacylglycerol--serine O-ph